MLFYRKEYENWSSVQVLKYRFNVIADEKKVNYMKNWGFMTIQVYSWEQKVLKERTSTHKMSEIWSVWILNL